MSRPEPVFFALKSWDIVYSSQYFESSSRTGTRHYRATIIWEAQIGENKTSKRQSETFVDFDEAKKWINKEIK